MASRPKRSNAYSGMYNIDDEDNSSVEASVTSTGKDEALEYESDSNSDGEVVVLSPSDPNKKPPPRKTKGKTRRSNKKKRKKLSPLGTTVAAKASRPMISPESVEAATAGTAVDRSRGYTASRQRPRSTKDALLFTNEPSVFDTSEEWWNQPYAKWSENVSEEMMYVFQNDMHVGKILNAALAADDFAEDVKNFPHWIDFSNGRTTNGNGGFSLGNLYLYHREYFKSLEPIFRVMDRYQDTSPGSSESKAWIHGNNSIKSPNATNTHGKHSDGLSPVEMSVQETFGVETTRARVAISFTPPAGVHQGRTKETRYAYKGEDVLELDCDLFSYIIMGRRVNGKDKFFVVDEENEEDAAAKDNTTDDIALGLGNDDLPEDYGKIDGDGEDAPAKVDHMKHGIYNNACALSVMLELPVQKGKVREFCHALSTCYDDYVPRNPKGSIKFEFPVAKKSYREPKKEEKRQLAADAFKRGPFRLIQAFIQERGHGAIASELIITKDGAVDPRLLFLAHKIRVRYSGHSLNPHVKTLLDSVGFVFNVRWWMAGRMVDLMEAYCRNGSDINRIPKNHEEQGYKLGQQICIWKSSGGPRWMNQEPYKSRLDAIGFDISLGLHQAKFAHLCHRYKVWKIANNGRSPGSGGKNDTRDDEEKCLYMFQWKVTSGKHAPYVAHMKVPKLRALFDEAHRAGSAN